MIQNETESRHSLRVECNSSVLCDLGARKIPARLLDLSWTGLRLESERPIPSGSLIQLQGATAVWCVCRWCARTPEGNYWSGHELRNGALSPSQQWVRKILESNGLNQDQLRNRRRIRRYHTDIRGLVRPAPNCPLTARASGASLLATDRLAGGNWELVEGQPGQVTNLSLFGACLVHETRLLQPELSLQLDLGGRPILLQASCLQARGLRDGRVAHHLCWEARPAQTRAVAFLLSREETG